MKVTENRAKFSVITRDVLNSPNEFSRPPRVSASLLRSWGSWAVLYELQGGGEVCCCFALCDGSSQGLDAVHFSQEVGAVGAPDARTGEDGTTSVPRQRRQCWAAPPAPLHQAGLRPVRPGLTTDHRSNSIGTLCYASY
ncbi:hypothetical protein AAFF_G00031820 [Aldrovandia affinis]|uniref:Uncharacterized protein n=1 Tax=Aldrovandia affinis TaxID=143900 RepID=A0AAD7S437_9TELE|nr:hypothetical protein AAFF_G00031820 [Aldrovandia affinis]